MNSLYGRLFRYREREGRSPVEDFLTEALADLLNRVPRQLLLDFTSTVLFNDSASRAEVTRQIASAQDVLWKTQCQIPGGRLDILLELNRIPALIIENKVVAPVAKHGPISEPEDEVEKTSLADRSQLMTYGNWLLRERVGREWLGGLVLLTFRTYPPEDFGKGDAAYGVTSQCVCRWPGLWRWLRQISGGYPNETESDRATGWFALAKELCQFLEEQAMDSGSVRQAHIAASQIFIPAFRSLEKAFDYMTDLITAALRSNQIALGKIRPLYMDSDGGVISRWVYLRAPSLPKEAQWCVQWGIRFPEISSWWNSSDPSLPRIPHAFIYINDDNLGLPQGPLDTLTLPPEWLLVRESGATDRWLIASRPLHELVSESGDMTDHLVRWCVEKTEEIGPTLKKLLENSAG